MRDRKQHMRRGCRTISDPVVFDLWLLAFDGETSCDATPVDAR